MTTTIVPAGARTAKLRRPSLATPCDVWGSPLDPGRPMSPDAPGRWFALRIAPQAEFVTGHLLRRRGVSSWVPYLTKWVQAERYRRTQKVEVRRPLLPGYGFVKIADYRAWSIVFGVSGVLSVLTCAGRAWPLREADIEKLERESHLFRAQEAERLMPTNRAYAVGDDVEVVEGSFRGLTVRVTDIGSSEARGLVLLFGRETEIQIPVANLGAVA